MLSLYSVTEFKGVGPKIAEKLAKMGIKTALDVLLHLPIRYQDKTRITPMIDAKHDGEYLLEGEIVQVQSTNQKNNKRLKLVLSDGKFHINILFMHVYPSMMRYKEGMHLRVFGKVKGYGVNKTIVHPEVWVVNTQHETVVDNELTPIYSKVEGIHQALLRNLSAQVLSMLNTIDKPFLPEALLEKFNLSTFKEAVELIHYPTPDVHIDDLLEAKHVSVKRLIFEELLAHHLNLLVKRKNEQHKDAYLLNNENAKLYLKNFLSALPFKPTNAQQRVIKEIESDLSKAHPMLRLVQGDVGSGKNDRSSFSSYASNRFRCTSCLNGTYGDPSRAALSKI